MAGVYGEDTYRVDVAYPYIIAVNNLSQFMAMYCLVLFYKANKVELGKSIKPDNILRAEPERFIFTICL